eukprot:g11398.t2
MAVVGNAFTVLSPSALAPAHMEVPKGNLQMGSHFSSGAGAALTAAGLVAAAGARRQTRRQTRRPGAMVGMAMEPESYYRDHLVACRAQLNGGPMNIGAIAVMPEGWKLAPKDRLPKPLKKEMKGLAWAPYSKEYPNIVVAGPVPGETYEKMVLPVLSPDPNTDDTRQGWANLPLLGSRILFGKGIFYFGGNRGRGQVYPEGNQSNNNQFMAAATGTISAIDGLKVSITTPSGEVKTQECLVGADIVVQVGDEVTKDEPLTTNPNVGGFGQELTEDETGILLFSVWTKALRSNSLKSPGHSTAMALAPAFVVGPSVAVSPAALQVEHATRSRQISSGHGSAGAGAALGVAGLAAAAGLRKSMRGRRSTKGSVMVGNANVAEPESYYRDHLGIFYFGGNRGRGQVYPEGNQSNNNHRQNVREVSITTPSGEVKTQECLVGADIVVQVGDEVTKDEPLTTNPNVGGFGQEEKECVLQDMNRVYAYCAFAFSCFIAQLSFVLKKMLALCIRAALQMEKAARGQMPSGHGSAGAGAALAVAGLAAAAGVRKSMRGRRSTKASVMVGNTNVAEPESYYRDHLEYPNIVVAGPVPGETYEKMVLPVLSPDPNTDETRLRHSDKILFGKGIFYFGGNRGRGQVYPEGNQSNNNQFMAAATGTISAIDGLKVSITTPSGEVKTQECLVGADIVVQVGDEVTKDEPLTTNPNANLIKFAAEFCDDSAPAMVSKQGGFTSLRPHPGRENRVGEAGCCHECVGELADRVGIGHARSSCLSGSKARHELQNLQDGCDIDGLILRLEYLALAAICLNLDEIGGVLVSQFTPLYKTHLKNPRQDPKVPGDLASTRRAIQENDLAASEKKEVFAKVLSSAPLQPIIYQRAPSPSGWNGAVRFVPSPRHSSPPLSQPFIMFHLTAPGRELAKAAVFCASHGQCCHECYSQSDTRYLYGACIGPGPIGEPWRQTSSTTTYGSTVQLLEVSVGRPCARRRLARATSCTVTHEEGRLAVAGATRHAFAQTETTASPLSAAGRSPSEGRVPSGPGGLPGWTAGGGSCARRDGSRPAPHSFNLCRSSTSMSSHNASFYAPQSAMGGGGFSTTPVPAASYIVDIADPVDQMLGSALRTLDAAAASKLMLRRLAPGRYEIDGRKVSVRWSEQGGLMVIEDEVRGSPMPLPAYLGQAGNVVASLTGHRADMPKITRVPKSQRLTFDDAKAEKNLAAQIEKLGSERCESMRLAVEQARLREEAAEAYEKLTQGFAPSRMLRPSPVRTSLVAGRRVGGSNRALLSAPAVAMPRQMPPAARKLLGAVLVALLGVAALNTYLLKFREGKRGTTVSHPNLVFMRARDGREVLLIGTVPVDLDEESSRLVRDALNALQPEVVMLEGTPLAGVQAMMSSGRWEMQGLQKPNDTDWMHMDPEPVEIREAPKKRRFLPFLSGPPAVPERSKVPMKVSFWAYHLTSAVGGNIAAAARAKVMALAPAFTVVSPSVTAPHVVNLEHTARSGPSASGLASTSAGAALAVAGLATAASVRKTRNPRRSKGSVMVGNANAAEPESYYRDHLDKILFGKGIFYFGGNRGRGQVYPEGNQSNNNQFLAAATGTISAIDGLKVSITTPSGEVKTQECLIGADIVVQVGDEVTKDEPITTNPNVGGFGQEEKECVLQDMNRVYAYCAFAFSCFIAQLSFVLKKMLCKIFGLLPVLKQFEKTVRRYQVMGACCNKQSALHRNVSLRAKECSHGSERPRSGPVDLPPALLGVETPQVPGDVSLAGTLSNCTIVELAKRYKAWLYLNPKGLSSHFVSGPRISNRAVGFPTEAIERAGCRLLILDFFRPPVPPEQTSRMLEAMSQLPRPLMVQCTTGTRSSALLILWLAKHAGHNLESALREGVLIDPCLNRTDAYLMLLDEAGIHLKYVLNTHCHYEHMSITGSDAIRKLRGDVKLLSSKESGAAADEFLVHGQLVHFGHYHLEVRATPGHTSGCLTYVLHGLDHPKVAFTGDALLVRGCGRTDFAQGDAGRLYDSVHAQIFTLDPDTRIYPCHEYNGRNNSTVGEEKAYNPRLTHCRDDFILLMDELELPKPKFQVCDAIQAWAINIVMLAPLSYVQDKLEQAGFAYLSHWFGSRRSGLKLPGMTATKAGQWMVTVSISGSNRLGVDADWSDGKTLYIKAILAGAVSDWNKENPAKAVQPGDRVISVNGVSGDAQAMVREIKDRSLLQLLFQKAGDEKPEEPEPVPVPGVARAGMPLDIPGMPPRTVDVLLEIRARAAEKANARKGIAPKPPPKPANEPPNHYEVLGIDLRADDAAIKKGYRKLVLQWHPDKHPADRAEAEVKIRQINLAYETISNPLKRQSYDQMLQAIERKRLNIRLETLCRIARPSWAVWEAMTGPEFMLCPLGHSDKFVRIVDNQLLVQSRDDALGIAFQEGLDHGEGVGYEFFQAAKFSLWWLPEVNNMCRLRARETAGQGMEGGINVSFQFEAGQEEDDTVESACELSEDQDWPHQEPKRCNLIVSASPFSQGAYRFEGAFWPGRYMSFRGPDQLRMAGKVDESLDVADFLLVDFSAAYKFMTTSEVLKGAVEGQSGAQGGYVKLGDLRADLSVRLYFQQMLGSAVWNNKDFETFFEGHYEEWDFDAKKSRVRMRPDGPLMRQAPQPVTTNGERSPCLKFRQDAWSDFLKRCGGIEMAGRDFYQLLFEKEPELKKLFAQVPEMAQHAAFMRAMSRYIQLLTQPDQLKIAIEMLAFTHVRLG